VEEGGVGALVWGFGGGVVVGRGRGGGGVGFGGGFGAGGWAVGGKVVGFGRTKKLLVRTDRSRKGGDAFEDSCAAQRGITAGRKLIPKSSGKNCKRIQEKIGLAKGKNFIVEKGPPGRNGKGGD